MMYAFLNKGTKSGKTAAEGLLIAAGFKSSVVLAHIVGELVADIIPGRKIKYDLKEFAAG